MEEGDGSEEVGCGATREAPVATGGGISASSTARPFFTVVSMDWRVCGGEIFKSHSAAVIREISNVT